MEHAQVGTEELAGLGEGIDAALHEQVGQDLVDAQFLCQLTDRGGVAGFLHHPFLLDTHKLRRLICKDNKIVGLYTKKC